MSDVALAIDGEAVNVTHTASGIGFWGDDGRWNGAAQPPVMIRAAIQPASGRQLMDMPEGIREEARWIAWSRSQIGLDDRIAHGGQSFRVLIVWPRMEGVFWRAALGLVK